MNLPFREGYKTWRFNDLTSHAEDEFVKFSPFYPHGGIDKSVFRNNTMKNQNGRVIVDFENFGVKTLAYAKARLEKIS